MDEKVYDTGMSIRRDVLGAEYVDNAMASADEVWSLLSAISMRILPTARPAVGMLCTFMKRTSSLTGIRLSLLPGMR